MKSSKKTKVKIIEQIHEFIIEQKDITKTTAGWIAKEFKNFPVDAILESIDIDEDGNIIFLFKERLIENKEEKLFKCEDCGTICDGSKENVIWYMEEGIGGN